MGRTAAATKEPPKFLRVADVAAMLDISESHAYKIMRQLNKELEAKGKIVTAGRVSRRYLEERMYFTHRHRLRLATLWTLQW